MGRQCRQGRRCQTYILNQARPAAQTIPRFRPVAHPHLVALPIPRIEITHNRDASCVWRPNREAHSGYTIDSHNLRAETTRQFEMAALIEQVKVDVT